MPISALLSLDLSWFKEVKSLSIGLEESCTHDFRSSLMPLKTKRWNDPKGRDDGYRLLICRYRPRGVRKADETWDAWCSDLGPSRKLHADFYGKNGPPISWEQYRQRYLREMEAQRELIAELADLLKGGAHITLLCSSACTDASRCHRSLLQQLVEREIERGQAVKSAKGKSLVTQERAETAEPGSAKTRRGRLKKSRAQSPK